jgi:predicted dehydrogenase
LELLGADGRIIIDATREGADVWAHGPATGRPAESGDARDGRDGRDGPGGWYRGTLCRPRGASHLVPPADTGSTMAAAIAELIAAVEEDREPVSSGRDGRAALEIALACHASECRGGARVALPLERLGLRVASR